MLDNLIGQKLNSRYEIIQKLGAGGLGAVYKARDTELDREVAIKLIKPDALWASPDAQDIFLREARTIARLDHPNILPVYDIVKREQDPEYPLFLVTKLARGGSLHNYLHPAGSIPRPLSIREAGKILNQVAAALDHAHSQKVIHLDIKPSNILFADTTGQTVLVADFGLARLLETTTHVRISGRSGTRDYMPYEQLVGGEAGRYSDVYALGITLYEMLTSEVPKKSLDTSGFTLQFNRPLPPKVKQVIERATQLDPHQRYQSAGELASAFKEAARSDHKPPASRPGSYSGSVPASGPLPAAPGSGSVPSTPGSGPVPAATVYPPFPQTPTPSYPPYPYAPRPSYPPVPPSGPPLPPSGALWPPVAAVKPVNSKARICLWLSILTFIVGAIVASQFYALKGRGLTGEVITDLLAAWLGMVTVVLGHQAKSEIRQSNNQMKGKVRATIGLVFGYLNIALFLFDIFTLLIK